MVGAAMVWKGAGMGAVQVADQIWSLVVSRERPSGLMASEIRSIAAGMAAGRIHMYQSSM